MAQFKRFNSSENPTRSDTTAAYSTGTLTWDDVNGLRLHDGSTAGGNAIGGGGSTAPFTLSTGTEDTTVYDTISVPSGDNIWLGNGGVNLVMIGGTNVRTIVDDANNNFYISYSDEGLANGIPDSGNSYHWKFNGNDNTLEMPFGGAFKPNGSTTTNQVLKIVPTGSEAGDHIHLLSGNISITSIFLGTDQQYVRTNIDGSMTIGTNDVYPDTSGYGHRWVFGTDGATTFPNDTILGTGADPNVYIETVANGTTSTWTFGTNGVLTLPAATPVIQGNGAGTDVTIIATTGTNTATWVFSASGTVTLPGPINNVSVGTVTTTGSLDPAYPTAIDLTKTVNKLADNVGSTYTLADGVEGQIMYLVPQTGATMTGVNVTVNHARIIDNSTSTALVVTDALLAPFNCSATPVPTMGVTTLIFTDGAWQADAGVWTY